MSRTRRNSASTALLQTQKPLEVRLEEAKTWVINVTGLFLGSDEKDLREILSDGVVLCSLFHKLNPEKFPLKSINRKFVGVSSKWKKRENIELFLNAAIDQLKIPEASLFSVTEIYDWTNPSKVVDSLFNFYLECKKRGFITNNLTIWPNQPPIKLDVEEIAPKKKDDSETNTMANKSGSKSTSNAIQNDNQDFGTTYSKDTQNKLKARSLQVDTVDNDDDDDFNVPAKKDIQEESKAKSVQNDAGNNDTSKLPAKKDVQEESKARSLKVVQEEPKARSLQHDAVNNDDSNVPAKKDIQEESKARSLQVDTVDDDDDDSNVPAKKDIQEEERTSPISDKQNKEELKTASMQHESNLKTYGANSTILDGLPTALKTAEDYYGTRDAEAKKWIVARAKLHEAEMLIKSKNKSRKFLNAEEKRKLRKAEKVPRRYMAALANHISKNQTLSWPYTNGKGTIITGAGIPFRLAHCHNCNKLVPVADLFNHSLVCFDC